MPGVKVQVDLPTDGTNLRTPMVDGDPGQVIDFIVLLRNRLEVTKTCKIDSTLFIICRPLFFQLLGWGRNIFMGYLNRENETRDVFVPGNDPEKETTEDKSDGKTSSSDKQNWIKLGDLGFIDEDGFLVVLGRSEDFITLNTNEVISPTKVVI